MSSNDKSEYFTPSMNFNPHTPPIGGALQKYALQPVNMQSKNAYKKICKSMQSKNMQNSIFLRAKKLNEFIKSFLHELYLIKLTKHD